MEIGAYTLEKWGERQAFRYIDGLETCCRQLAENPQSGRPCDHIRSGLRRMEHARHVVFYRIESGRILVSRILHQRMLPERRTIDDEESGPHAG
jgi:toxin ParE1/3/4